MVEIDQKSLLVGISKIAHHCDHCFRLKNAHYDDHDRQFCRFPGGIMDGKSEQAERSQRQRDTMKVKAMAAEMFEEL